VTTRKLCFEIKIQEKLGGCEDDELEES